MPYPVVPSPTPYTSLPQLHITDTYMLHTAAEQWAAVVKLTESLHLLLAGDTVSVPAM